MKNLPPLVPEKATLIANALLDEGHHKDGMAAFGVSCFQILDDLEQPLSRRFADVS